MKLMFLAAAMAAIVAPAAHAADLIIADPAPMAMTDAGFDWSGFYAGLQAGYSNTRAVSNGVVTGVSTGVDVTGGLLGGTLGFNAQFDHFVLGLEGDLAWSGASGTAPCAAAPARDCVGDLDWLGTIKARAGVAMDSVLIFATAGFAAGGTTVNITPPAAGITNTFNGTMTGWTIGGGAELAVTDAISVKAEYNYVSMGNLQAPTGTLSSTQATDLSGNSHVVKVGVNYHF